MGWLRLGMTLVLMGVTVLGTKAGCMSRGLSKASAPRPMMRVAWARRHLAKVDEARRRGHEVQLVLVGDSITQNYERESLDDERDFSAVNRELIAPRHPLNLGFDGDQTQHALWRLSHGEVDGLTPRDVVVLLGINDILNAKNHFSAGEIADGIRAVAEEAHAKMPGARVTVMAILPAAYGADVQRIIADVNARLKQWVVQSGFTRWLDVSSLFMDGTRVRSELYYDPVFLPGAAGLHPDPVAQRRIAEAMLASLDAASK